VFVGVTVGVWVKVGVTLDVGVGVILMMSPSIHPFTSSILITIVDSL
jgi:hypothetical protein